MHLKAHLIACFVFLQCLATATLAATGPSILIAGYDSDNVVQFDLSTGKWTEIARLPQGSQPRGVAVGDAGEIYVGLHGGKRNLVKLIPGQNSTEMSDVTEAIGRFGPGILVASQGKIWAAGDTDRVIYRIDPHTGVVEAPSQYHNCCNLVGLAVDGDILYSAEYFQRSVLRYDLKSEKAEGVRFIDKSPQLNRPVGLTLGHNGNLYVANGLEPTVVEFDIKTGEYIRTFVDLDAGGQEGIHGILYVPETKHYYIASGSTLYEVDSAGTILASYNSPALKKAYGIALIPSHPNITAKAKPAVPPPSIPAGLNINGETVSVPHQQVTTLRLAPMTPGRMSIAGIAGKSYRVMATTDFKNWQSIGIVNNANGEMDFINPDADRFQMRFYRLEEIGSDQ